MDNKRFASPAEVKAPPGAEGWQELYPYYLLFDEKDDSQFWFCNSLHWPRVMRPFDVSVYEYAMKCLAQYNTRVWQIPSSNGLDIRIHNGYTYHSAIDVPLEQIADRVPVFLERAGFYFQNWDQLLEQWDGKVQGMIDELEALDFSPLPDKVDTAWVFEARGLDNSYDLAVNYDKALQLLHKNWQYHFEFLNLGYGAYLDFFGFCKEAFPGIPDLSIARMVQGFKVDLFRPDDELKRLAKLAVRFGLADALKQGSVDEALAAVAQQPNGAEWIADWESVKQPWFNFSTANNHYSDDKLWIEHLEIPLGFLRNYLERVEAGIEIDRPIAALAAERDRIISEYSSLLSAEQQAVFQGKLGLAHTVFPHVENHSFYIDHWARGVFWRKIYELSRTLAGAGFFNVPDDMFYLRREELLLVISDYSNSWAIGAEPRGGAYWKPEIERRRAIIDALKTQQPVPAFNEPPETITEPFTVMLWGITTEQVNGWLGHDVSADTLSGTAAAPGVVEGIARVVLSADALDEVQDGEILITLFTAPCWAPVFTKIKATVTDIGGMMSHAAIVCREYGLPAVTGTGNATQAIHTGQRIQVDGGSGKVKILA